ncbi:MAG: right-handed parallel beta-helix repeat-containing protein, partial [Rhodobacteraceae bacterium]|nr:right-handed parallel beta-helix repeat-containing protein [Paracoccaceae bacterium]
MNKAITDGLLLMPPPFANGLSAWSRENGTPGSATYAGASDAAFVEITKTEAVQRLRWTGETPILPGCYLRISARVKALSGALPSVRIGGWAGGAGGAAVAGLPAAGPSVALTGYGQVVEVSAIVGTGRRTGVDMVWGGGAVYGHFGLDLTGPAGGVVRIDDIAIEDVTGAFLRTMTDWVDVRDYGALGDGVTDDRAAFAAADAAAAG